MGRIKRENEEKGREKQMKTKEGEGKKAIGFVVFKTVCLVFFSTLAATYVVFT